MSRNLLNLWARPVPEGGEYPNSGRQFEIDLVKCISILILPLCHMCEEFVQMETYLEPTIVPTPEGIFNGICEFCWGTAGAPVFMFCLGAGIIYSRRTSFGYLAARSGKTLIMALLLSLFTQTISLLIHGLLENSPELIHQAVGWLFCCDILGFAALTFLFFALVMRFRIPNLIVLLIPVILLIISMFVPVNLCADNIVAADLIGWFFWQNTTYSFFPFCQWLIFPAAGYIFAQFLRNTTDKTKFYKRLMITGISVFAVFTAVLLLLGVNITLFFTTYEGAVYNHDMVSAAWNVSFILFEMGLFYFISRLFRADSTGHRFVTYISRSLITLYCIQWLIIAFTYYWILPALGVLPLYGWGFVLAAACVYAALFTITIGYQQVKKRIRAGRTANA